MQVLACGSIELGLPSVQTVCEGTHLGHYELRDQRNTICVYEEAYVESLAVCLSIHLHKHMGKL